MECSSTSGNWFAYMSRTAGSLSAGSKESFNVTLISLSFFLVYLGFSAMQNLESTVNKEGGLGSVSQGLYYGSMAVGSLFAPGIVHWLSPRLSIPCGFTFYWIYVAANLNPSWWTLMPSSLCLGIMGAVMWVAEGMYVANAARAHARRQKLDLEVVLGAFNSRFWAFYFANQLVGNTITFSVYQFIGDPMSGGNHGIHGNRSALTVDYGASWKSREPFRAILSFTTVPTEELHSAVSHAQTMLCTVLLICLFVGTAIACCLADMNSSEVTALDELLLAPDEDISSKEEGAAAADAESGNLVARTETQDGATDGALPLRQREGAVVAAIWHGKRRMDMILLLLLFTYSGLEQAFLAADFTSSVVAPALGIGWVGGMTAVYGAADAIGAFTYGWFSRSQQWMVGILVFGISLQLTVIIGLFFHHRFGDTPSDLAWMAVCALLWGFGDSAINSQLSSLLAIHFPTSLPSVISEYMMFLGIGASSLFLLSPISPFALRMIVLFIIGAAAITGLLRL